ncbi:hypothetical protein [Methylobacterium nodulans]|uniref:hypothetical protein n=1 Tax=Methylobacterium nodulans TaxID=114616 RepID=UPI0012ECFCB6|nr:hypothetical protein [Methylobacterium nodulans]
MTADFELTTVQIDGLRKAIVTYCALSDLEAALNRYPGSLGRAETIPEGQTFERIVQVCLDRIATDQALLVNSFLLRVLENRWSLDPLRREALRTAPILVRAPRKVEGQVTIVADALQALVDALPEKPRADHIGDPVIFTALCEIRDALVALARCFEAFEGLKGLHDGLHTLQVLGASWLDWSQAEEPPALLPTALALVHRAQQVATASQAGLPPEGVACQERCLRALDRAKTLLTSGQPDAIREARSQLRALLIAEMPHIDEILFGVSRDLPLKSFSAAFTKMSESRNLDRARDAAIDLADTLRRRLMEHAVWQATDLRLYQMEEHLYDPQLGWMVAVTPILTAVRTNLRAVSAAPNEIQSLTGPMSDALTQYEATVSPGAAPGEDDPAFARVRECFEDLRASVRGNFLEIDQLLKADFARCAVLKTKLDALLARVPPLCALWVP